MLNVPMPGGATDKVVIEGLVVQAHVGVSDGERASAQRCRIDLELRADLARAGAADDLARTVDYGAVVEALREVAALTTPRLLETLAEAMARTLLERFGPGAGRPAGGAGVVTGLKLRLVKLDPPLDASVDAIGIELDRAAVRKAPGARDRAGFR